MGQSFAHYVTTNEADILKDVFFSFFGLILGWIFSSKSQDVSNETSITQSIHFVNQNIIYTHYNDNNRSLKRSGGSKSDSDISGEIGAWFIGLVLVSFFFVKYHSYLLTYTTGFVLMSITCTVTIAIKLYMNNNFGDINKLWTLLSFIIIGVDFLTLIYLYKQDITAISTVSVGDFINSIGLNGVLKYSYYALGFLFVQMPNILLLLLMIHMFALNAYLARNGRISSFIVRKTRGFTVKPGYITVLTIFICLISILFSSGLLYDWLSKNNQMMATFKP